MIGGVILRRRHLRWLAAGAVAVFCAAVGLGWRAERSVELATRSVAAPAWALPTANVPDTARDAAILRARHPWGGQVSFRDIDAAPPPAAQPWTLVGTIVRDDHRFALIQIGPRGAGKLEYLDLGDKLPDGSVVDEIAADSITAASNPSRASGRVIYRLFEKKS